MGRNELLGARKMITEFRRLVFSSSEIEKAIKAFSKEQTSMLPEGEILGMEIVGEPDIGVRVRVGDVYGGSKEQEVVIDAVYLGAAMLFHCKQNRIPMPRTPKKTLERVGDGLALSFSINAAPEMADVRRTQATTKLDENNQGKDLKRGQGEVILVLEDDPEVRALAVNALAGVGYRVLEASDANAATQVLEAEAGNLDLLLSDVVLPGGVGGPEFAGKAKGLYPKLKVVFMTGYAVDINATDKALDIGEAVLNKPFKRAELASVIRDTLAE